MNKQEAKRSICASIAATIYNDVECLAAGYLGYGVLSQADIRRMENAAIELAYELRRRSEYRPVGLPNPSPNTSQATASPL